MRKREMNEKRTRFGYHPFTARFEARRSKAEGITFDLNQNSQSEFSGFNSKKTFNFESEPFSTEVYDITVEKLKSLRRDLRNSVAEHSSTISTMDARIINLNDKKLLTRADGSLKLQPIKSRLVWQHGEYPVHKVEAHWIRLVGKVSSAKKVNLQRPCHHISIRQNDIIPEYELSDDFLTVKGILYITNCRIFFRVKKDRSYPIMYSHMIERSFYSNALEVKHLLCDTLYTDVFFLSDEQSLLLDVIVQAVD